MVVIVEKPPGRLESWLGAKRTLALDCQGEQEASTRHESTFLTQLPLVFTAMPLLVRSSLPSGGHTLSSASGATLWEPYLKAQIRKRP